jgi:hypothetical protein
MARGCRRRADGLLRRLADRRVPPRGRDRRGRDGGGLPRPRRAARAREARELQAETLGYVASSGDTEFLLDALELAAIIAADLGEGPRAARLASAAEAHRRQAGMPVGPEDAALLEQYLAPARNATAPQEWAGELAKGAALTDEQAIALLLDIHRTS